MAASLGGDELPLEFLQRNSGQWVSTDEKTTTMETPSSLFIVLFLLFELNFTREKFIKPNKDGTLSRKNNSVFSDYSLLDLGYSSAFSEDGQRQSLHVYPSRASEVL